MWLMSVKYKSKLEERFAKLFPEAEYEKDKFGYELQFKYTPDWKIREGVYAETKGYFDGEDRRKHLALRDQHPEVKIIFVFENPNKKIHTKSSTTYAEWCDKHNFEWKSIKQLEQKEVKLED